LKPDDRDILFGDRFGGYHDSGGDPGGSGAWTPLDAEVDALMDAYFDGDIADDDRVRLFELLRRDPDRCLQFVEMQRAALLLERAPAGPDQTEAILARVARSRAPLRIGPRAARLAIAAAVLLAGAGLVVLGQSGPPNSFRAPVPSPHATESNHAAAEIDAPADPGATAIAETPAGPASRPALQPGILRSTRAGLFTDPGQPEVRINGLAEAAPGAATASSLMMDPAIATRIRELEGFGAAPSDIRRLMGFAYGGNTPWGIIGMWPLDDAWAKPGPVPAPTPQR
jgi:hypothetical protein